MLNFDSLSYWEKETYINHTDYLIIGSGIVGLSTAIHLKQRNKGKKVTILERGYLPTGASTKNAGFSCIGSPSELLDDLSHTSESKVFETVSKRWEGLRYLKEMLGENGIGYQALGSYELFRATDKESYAKCIEKLPYLNKQMQLVTGIQNVFSVNNLISKQAEFNGFEKAISHAAEGQIDTGKMMKSLLKKAISMDINIINGISVNEINKQTVTTNFGKIKFEKLAISTNGFAQKFLPKEDIAPARAQIIVTSPIKNLPFKGVFHFDKGYYYFRSLGNRVLFGGGRNLDFKGEETEEIATTEQIKNVLESILKTTILPRSTFTIEHSWAGIMGVGKTKNPILKKVDENIYCGVRLGGMGVAIGTLVGKELAELLTN